MDFTEQFRTMREELEMADEARDTLIKQSRDLLRDAKHAIYLCHEGKLDEAAKMIAALAEIHGTLLAEDAAQRTGAYGEALEEYVEAAVVLAFLREQDIPFAEELGVPTERYLAGLADATGELARHAVFRAIERDKKGVARVHAFISGVQGGLVQFHLRNGLLRKKYDGIKYALKTVEQALYDLSLKE